MLSSSLIFWLACAVTFFWAVGAYNRLVRLRAGVRKAFAALDELLLRQVVWVQGCLPASMRSGAMPEEDEGNAAMPSETEAVWSRLSAASEQFSVALAHLRAQPIDGVTTASLAMAHEMLLAAWDGAMENAVAPDADPSAERLNARWMTLLHQAVPPQEAFNSAVNAYNGAIRQFPAILLAKLFSFRPAGQIHLLNSSRSAETIGPLV
ncbi:MAG: LemA family protein [Ottowia sp.]|uniref:LemA family protein n=1 Tax=unclassified Ottowia TaxID=2645081 RepID=UPI003C2AC312